MTTYQKLKAENKKLREALREVVLRPDSGESGLIKSAVKMQASAEKAFWFGSAAAATKFDGLIKLVQ